MDKYIYEFTEINPDTGMCLRKRISEDEYNRLSEAQKKRDAAFDGLRRAGALFEREDLSLPRWTVSKYPAPEVKREDDGLCL